MSSGAVQQQGRGPWPEAPGSGAAVSVTAAYFVDSGGEILVSSTGPGNANAVPTLSSSDCLLTDGATDPGQMALVETAAEYLSY